MPALTDREKAILYAVIRSIRDMGTIPEWVIVNMLLDVFDDVPSSDADAFGAKLLEYLNS